MFEKKTKLTKRPVREENGKFYAGQLSLSSYKNRIVEKQ